MKTTYNVIGGGIDVTGLSLAELFNTVVSFTDEMNNLVNELNQSQIEIIGTYLRHGDIAKAMCEGTLIEYTKTVCETMTRQLEEELSEDKDEFTFYQYTITKVDKGDVVSTTDVILSTPLKANIFTTDKDISCTLGEYLDKCGVLKEFMDGEMGIIEVNALLISQGVLPVKINYARFGSDYMTFDELMDNAQEHDVEPADYMFNCFLADEVNNGRTFGEWLDFLQGLSN